MTWQVLQGDCLAVLGEMESESVQTCVTSPPYWGLRDYGTATWKGGDVECDHRSPTMREGRNEDRAKLAGSEATNAAQLLLAARSKCGKCGAHRIDSQLGLEPTPEQYVENLVAVMREVRRVLRADGTLWLNLGDSYNAGRDGGHPGGKAQWKPEQEKYAGRSGVNAPGLKPKDLVGIPWRVAFALQADGWWLRSDIVWSKPNPMPESVTDRPTRSHEYIFLLTKSARYFYDADAIREEQSVASVARYEYGFNKVGKGIQDNGASHTKGQGADGGMIKVNPAGRNRRSVWEITTQPYPEAHFATFPPKLVEPCILAGAASGALVLDPFCGAGTTGVVALRHDRSFIGIELNPEYVELARNRIRDDAPLLNTGIEAAA